jgi:hypothetical protein
MSNFLPIHRGNTNKQNPVFPKLNEKEKPRIEIHLFPYGGRNIDWCEFTFKFLIFG